MQVRMRLHCGDFRMMVFLVDDHIVGMDAAEIRRFIRQPYVCHLHTYHTSYFSEIRGHHFCRDMYSVNQMAIVVCYPDDTPYSI